MTELIHLFVKENLIYINGELYWKHQGITKRRKLDVPAGFVMNNGYRHIKINGKRYPYHRIIWLYHFGVFPNLLDHIDRNRLNNKIENLREVTTKQNARNRSKSSGKSSRYLGVSFNKRNNKYVVRVMGKYLGGYDTEYEASSVYRKVAKESYGEYFGDV